MGGNFATQEILTELQPQEICNHRAGCDDYGCQCGWTQPPHVVHSSRIWETQHQEEINVHLEKGIKLIIK